MIKIIIAILAFISVLGIYNKIQERREAKKIMDEVKNNLITIKDPHLLPSMIADEGLDKL